MVELKITDLDKDYSADNEVADMYICENKKGEDVYFQVARSSNPEHEKVQRSYTKRLEVSRRQPKKARRYYAEIVAKSILRGLGKLLDDDGKAVANTIENKVAILEKYPSLFRDVMEFSLDIRNYQKDEDEEDAPEDVAGLTPEEDTEKNLKK